MIGQNAQKKLIKTMLFSGIFLVLGAITFHFFIETKEVGDICNAVYPAAIGATLITLVLVFLMRRTLTVKLTPIFVIGGLTLIYGTAFCFFQILFSSGGSGLLGMLGLFVCLVLTCILAVEQKFARLLKIKSTYIFIAEIILLPFIYFLLVNVFTAIAA